ncbi:hypothetical protein DVQ18_12710 [Yersinia enterocolitica]|nr:hypothetical protein [Yersinia enterocolitica]EKN6104847.1 hypothetical protein [Yersinia enterocolitica]
MLSKEQLEKIANPVPVDVGGTQSPIVTEMAIELLESRAESLSLREQLAELKALEPAAWMDEKGNVCTIDNRLRGLTAECADAYRKYNIPLFTAAKPAEDKC